MHKTLHHPHHRHAMRSTGTCNLRCSPIFHAGIQISHLGLTAFCLFFLSGHGAQLLQYKADINAVNEHGNVPLHYACFWGQDQVAEVSTQMPSPGMGRKQSEPETFNLSYQYYHVTLKRVVTAREVAGILIITLFIPGSGG